MIFSVTCQHTMKRIPTFHECSNQWLIKAMPQLSVSNSRTGTFFVRFEVFTAVTMKNGVFWDVTPCGSCKNRRFGGTWRLVHQGDRFLRSVRRLLVAACVVPSSPILVTLGPSLFKCSVRAWRTGVSVRCGFSCPVWRFHSSDSFLPCRTLRSNDTSLIVSLLGGL
jgi:hypothetical protein